jgi:hypothetical protein
MEKRRSIGMTMVLTGLLGGLAFWFFVDRPITTVKAPPPNEAFLFATVSYVRWLLYAAGAALICVGVPLLIRGQASEQRHSSASGWSSND